MVDWGQRDKRDWWGGMEVAALGWQQAATAVGRARTGSKLALWAAEVKERTVYLIMDQIQCQVSFQLLKPLGVTGFYNTALRGSV